MSASPWSTTVFSAGPYATGANGHNVRGTTLVDLGRTYRFSIQVPNDAAVSNIQGYGSMAVPVGNPFTLRGVVRNAGNNALAAVPVTLTISGANTYTQTQNAPAQAVGGTAVVTFPGISLTNVGTNTVTVSVPSDGNNSNNTFSQTMATSATDFSFVTPGLPQTSSYGFTAGNNFTSAFCGKFTVSAARAVTAVRAVIGSDANLAPNATNGQQSTTVFGVVVEAATGAILGRSADYVLVAGDLGQLRTFTLPSPVTVPPGDFLVGLAQMVTATSFQVFPMAYQAEVPARPGLFFSTGVSNPGPPTDATANNARYMLEAVTAAPANNDVAVNEIQGYGSVAVPAGNPVSLRAVVRNAGAAALTNVVVTLTITGANTVNQTRTVPSMAVGASSLVSFTGITLANVGANTVTVSVPADDNNANNTATQQMATSATRYSYITPGIPQTSSLGYPSAATLTTRAFCAKFTTNTPRDVTAVRAVIGNDTDLGTTPTTVYGVVLNPTTGAVIARSADYLITTADLGQLKTFTLSGSVPAGDFLVGLAQVLPAGTSSTQVFPMGYQAETPARAGLFFLANISTPGAPVDAAANNARFMLEAETTTPATCPVPTAFTVTGSTFNSASFSFAAATGATGYQIVYGVRGFTPGGAGSNTSPTFTGTTYTLTGLTSLTNYDFYIRTICSPTDQSALGGPVRVTTACAPPTISTFPYPQNFDGVVAGQALPCGITVLDSNNDSFTWRATGTVDPSLATGSVARSAPNAMVYSYNTADPTVGANDWFFTPALSMSATQRYRLTFYYRAGAGFTEGLEVKYGTAATPAGQTTTLYTNNAITSSLYRLASNISAPAVLDITPANGTYYVGFHAISLADQGFLAVDDLTISAGPLATSDALKRAVSVFPNPSASGVFNLDIRGANAKQALGVEVTNMLGQRVYTGTAKDNFQNAVNLSSLASGIYSLTVRNGQEYTQQQISIVK